MQLRPTFLVFPTKPKETSRAYDSPDPGKFDSAVVTLHEPFVQAPNACSIPAPNSHKALRIKPLIEKSSRCLGRLFWDLDWIFPSPSLPNLPPNQDSEL